MSGIKKFSRPRPPYEYQQRPDNCWSACLQMWLRAEIGATPSQDVINLCAPDFSFSAGSGMAIDKLGKMVDKALATLTVSMDYTLATTASELPDIKRLIREKGYVYLGYHRKDGTGHVNVLSAYNGDSYGCSDPDPEIKHVTKSKSHLLSVFPTFVGWRYREEGDLFTY